MDIHKTETSEGIAIIRLRGKCVASDVNKLNHFMEEMPEPGKYQVVLNMMNINIIDSYAIGFLMDRFQETKEKGGYFKLCNTQPLTKRLLSAADVDKVLEIYATEGEAIASIREALQEA